MVAVTTISTTSPARAPSSAFADSVTGVSNCAHRLVRKNRLRKIIFFDLFSISNRGEHKYFNFGDQTIVSNGILGLICALFPV